MQKRFTALVPQKILSAIGWGNPATYAEVFDYFSDKGMLISISRYYDFANECFGDGYDFSVDCENTCHSGICGDANTWIEAANYAIWSCLDFMETNKTI
jgi:hypothetical protein